MEGCGSGANYCIIDTQHPGTSFCGAGECSISRRPCVTEQDCRAIHCVDFKGSGGYLIGQNCPPANGLTCLEVQ